MSMVLLIWKAHLRSAYSALLQDTRTKITWLIALTFDVAAGFWSIHQLLNWVSQWHAAGSPVLEAHLWLLCLGAWGGISFFTILSTVTLGFGNDQSLLLMTLPIPPAARFRALYGLMFFEGIGNWLLLESIVVGVPLAVISGWQALAWLALLLAGVAVVAWVGIVATLLVMRYVLPDLRRALFIVLVFGIGIAVVYQVVHLAGLTLHAPSLPVPAPTLTSLLFVILLVLLIGPLVGSAGKLYLAAFHSMEGRASSHTVVNLPGMRALSKLLGRYRGLMGALLLKGVLNQSRNVFTWGRLVIVLVCVAIFPLVRTFLAPYRISGVVLVVVYSSGVAILAIVEYAAYAISSEGARLNLYLAAPPGIAAYLRARLVVFLIPMLSIGLALSLVFAWWTGLTAFETVLATLTIALVLIGYTTFIVWGSAWDEDLSLTAEGMMQVLMQEELPVTPRRLQLLGMSLLLIAAMFLLVWKLPGLPSMSALALVDGTVLAAGWRLSNAHLRGLVAGEGDLQGPLAGP
jgi:hypothetical protein